MEYFERLIKIINDLEMGKTAYFERNCGLGNGYVSKNPKEPRRTTLDQIIRAYPKVNREWLEFEKGQPYLSTYEQFEINEIAHTVIAETDMQYGLNDPSKIKTTDKIFTLSKPIPFYNVDVTLSTTDLFNDQTVNPAYYVNVPAFSDCDCTIQAYGNSMHPDIKSGSMIAIKEIRVESILPGEAYFIVTSDYRTIKYIRTLKGDDSKLRLVPGNKEDFDEAIINKSDIIKLFLVKGLITNKIL